MKIRNQLLAFILFGCFASAAFAQSSASSNGYAGGILVSPITVTNYSDLAFGSIIPTASSGTAVLGVTGVDVNGTGAISETPIATNCVIYNTQNNAANDNYPNPGLSVFQVTGQYEFTFAITLPSSAVTISDENRNGSMTVTNFTCVIGPTGSVATTGTLSQGSSSGGYQNFAVGGTLNIPGGAAAGNYAGQFTVGVAYN
jgi:hypothetical protein